MESQVQQDFEEVQISTAVPPAPGSVLGHNQPPAADTLEALAERLKTDNDDLIKKIAEWEAGMNRAPKEITTAEQATGVADFYKILNAGLGKLESRFEDAKKPIRERAAVVDTFFRGLRQQLDGWKRTLLGLSDGWQAKLRAEAARKAAAEAEQRRQQAEQMRREADKAAEAGRVGEATAVAAIAQEQERKAEKAQQMAVAPPSSSSAIASTFGGGIGTRRTWTYEVIDKKLMPVDFLEPNDTLIKAKVSTENKSKRLKDGEEYTDIIPGVKIYQKSSASGR